jgi:hypothetical protein
MDLMQRQGWFVYLDRDVLGGSYPIWVIRQQGDEDREILREGGIEKMAPNASSGPPTADLSKEAAQGLLEELWHQGFRPKGEMGSEGERAALKAHIDDLRYTRNALLGRLLKE